MRLWRLVKTRRTWRGKLRYVLDVGAELTPRENGLVTRHRVGRHELAAGPAALEADETTESWLDLANEVEGWGQQAVRKAIRLKSVGLWTALVSAPREARLTVGDLIAGKTFEADDVVELAMLMNLVAAGFEALQEKLNLLAAHDAEDEALTDDESDDDGVPPSAWGRNV